MGLMSYGLCRPENMPDENPYKIGDVITSHREKCKVIGFGKTPDTILIQSLEDGNSCYILWYQTDELLRPNGVK